MTATGTEAVSLAQLKTLADEIVERATYWQTGETFSLSNTFFTPTYFSTTDTTIKSITITISLPKTITTYPDVGTSGYSNLVVQHENTSSSYSQPNTQWFVESFNKSFLTLQLYTESLNLPVTDITDKFIAVIPEIQIIF